MLINSDRINAKEINMKNTARIRRLQKILSISLTITLVILLTACNSKGKKTAEDALDNVQNPPDFTSPTPTPSPIVDQTPPDNPVVVDSGNVTEPDPDSTPTPSVTPTPSPSPNPSVTPTPSAAPTPSATPDPTPTPSGETDSDPEIGTDPDPDSGDDGSEGDSSTQNPGPFAYDSQVGKCLNSLGQEGHNLGVLGECGKLIKVKVRNADLRNTSFRGAVLIKVKFIKSDLDNVDFTGANLYKVKFSQCDLRRTTWFDAIFQGHNFVFRSWMSVDGTDLKVNKARLTQIAP